MNTSTNNWVTKWNDFLSQHPQLNLIANKQSWIVPDASSESIAADHNFWKQVSESFPKPAELINLNSGAVSSSPFVVEKAYTTYFSLLNTLPSYFTLKEMESGRELVREGLANLINSSVDEVAIFRNTSEAMNNAIFGIDLKEGDEVVACRQDYIKTFTSWKQREQREKIKLNWVTIDGTEADDEVVNKYVSLFTDKTKVLQLTHVINWHGQVLPAELIIAEAKKRNIIVILDAAHSFGLLDTDVKKLNCDFMAGALHKWLSGPVAGGMLYVKKDQISSTWPLGSAVQPLSDNIRKFEELSIQVLPNILGVGFAIEFQLTLGQKVKEARLRYLRNYLRNGLKNIEGIKFKTPVKEEQSAAILNLSLDNWSPLDLEAELLKKYKIHVSPVMWEGMQGIRITPGVYTSTEELDKIIFALEELVLTC